MNYQLKSFAVLQTSAVVALVYFILSLIIVVPLFLISLAMPDTGHAFPMFGGVFLLFAPFLYAILGFIFTAIGCLLYNLIAKGMGGIAFTLEEK